MKKWLMLALMLVATQACAQVDPDPDGIGVYFDQTALDNCLENPCWFSCVKAYLIATNISADGMLGWECSLRTWPDPLPVPLQVDLGFPELLVPGGLNVLDKFPSLAVMYSEPVGQGDPTIVLATLSTMYLGGIIQFGIGPFVWSTPALPGGPAYVPGDDPLEWRYLHPSSDTPFYDYEDTYLVAAIGECLCAVPAEVDSWGRVKTLYQ